MQNSTVDVANALSLPPPGVRHARFLVWEAQRVVALPDAEEVALKRRLRAACNRSLLAAARSKAASAVFHGAGLADGDDAPPPPPQQSTTSAFVGDAVVRAMYDCYVETLPGGAGRRWRPRTLGILPQSVRWAIASFVPVVDPALWADLRCIGSSVLAANDAEVLRNAPLAKAMVASVARALRDTHAPHAGEAAVLLACVVGRPQFVAWCAQPLPAAATPAPVGASVKPAGQTPPDPAARVPAPPSWRCPPCRALPDAAAYTGLLARCAAEAAAQRRHTARLARWAAWRDAAFAATCASLRSTFRADIAAWGARLAAWRARRPGSVAAAVALAEHASLAARVRSVEWLGDPRLERDDARNLFWELGLPGVPAGATAGYTQSWTLAQAITLGVADVAWVRGYAWEDRPPPPGTAAAAVGAAANADGPLAPGNVPSGSSGESDSECEGGDGNGATVAVAVAVAVAAGRRHTRRTGAADEEAAEAERRAREAAAEALAREAAAAARARADEAERARQVAAHAMTQRVWISSLPFQPRTEHRFGGCELCSGLPIHHVGLRRPNAGASDDIGVCATCFAAHYADPRSVAHRMYAWHEVRSLVGMYHKEESGPNADASEGAPVAGAAAIEEANKENAPPPKPEGPAVTHDKQSAPEREAEEAAQRGQTAAGVESTADLEDHGPEGHTDGAPVEGLFPRVNETVRYGHSCPCD